MPPSSERYYVGQVGDVWLTSDQTETGVPCKLELTNDDLFADDYGMTATVASDGQLHSQSVALNSAAIPFEIKILWCPAALYNALISLLVATRSTSATVRVQLSSVKRTIDVLAKANGNGWLSTGSFSGGVIRDVVFRLISTGAGG
jgi:hypothetical protein